MKTITKKDNVSIVFGEWFDRINGNTYYDALVYIGDSAYQVQYRYGYNHGDKQAVDEVLQEIGYRVRTNKRDMYAPYRHIHNIVIDKKKRDLYKETQKIS